MMMTILPLSHTVLAHYVDKKCVTVNALLTLDRYSYK